MVDSVSLGEIERALAGGFTPGLHNGHADIVFWPICWTALRSRAWWNSIFP